MGLVLEVNKTWNIPHKLKFLWGREKVEIRPIWVQGIQVRSKLFRLVFAFFKTLPGVLHSP